MEQSQPRSAPIKILYVCVGNACRSQMAEAFTNHLGDGRVKAWSAGSSPLGWIAAGTEGVMAEKGISLAGHWSKSLEDVPLEDMDIIVGMGCEVSCPVLPGYRGRMIEWSIPDPYDRAPEVFRKVRDDIERQVSALLRDLLASNDAERGER